MVLQLTQDQILRLRPAQIDGVRSDTDVIFLEDATDNTSVAMKAGRRGRRHYSGDRIYESQKNPFTRGRVNSVALVNEPPEAGDRVISLTDNEYLGMEGTVTAVLDSWQIRVNFDEDAVTRGEDRRYWHPTAGERIVKTWVVLTDRKREVPPPPEVDPEDMKLSQWWIDRIKTYAAKGKRSNNWCSEIDKLVRELLDPVLVKWKVEANELVPTMGGFSVINPHGQVAAWFEDRAEADKLAAEKNKKLTV